ncbi:MAG TPA: hypothetical protein VI076_14965, partial [Actinopolymorphaceae bacterium]
PESIEALATAVTHRLADEPPPRARWRTRARAAVRRRWRSILAGGAVVLVFAGGLSAPVRAIVAEWFGFAGVVVVQEPESEESQRTRSTRPATPPPIGHDLTWDRARRLTDFDPVVPEELGPPDQVEVSEDRRRLTLGWELEDGRVRLDEFDGTPAPGFYKKYYGRPEQVTIAGGAWALWLPSSHEVTVLDAYGREIPDTRRSSGPTLVWPRGEVTLRLEGLSDLDAAIRIAESVR